MLAQGFRSRERERLCQVIVLLCCLLRERKCNSNTSVFCYTARQVSTGSWFFSHVKSASPRPYMPQFHMLRNVSSRWRTHLRLPPLLNTLIMSFSFLCRLLTLECERNCFSHSSSESVTPRSVSFICYT